MNRGGQHVRQGLLLGQRGGGELLLHSQFELDLE